MRLAAAGLALLGCEQDALEDGIPSQVECSSCHGSSQSSAPPRAIGDAIATIEIGVGAHQSHLTDSKTRDAIECRECHLVPRTVEEAGHVDPLPAELHFGPLASAGTSTPAWDRETATCSGSYCHGATLSGGTDTRPRWTQVDGSQAQCQSCHGAPPPPPHPQSERCSACHPQTTASDGTIRVAEGRHLNGAIDLDTQCDACHGSGGDPAPPVDLSGNTATDVRGVGAHRAHLTPAGWRASLVCSDCHQVPERVDQPGHLDSAAPAELAFSALATPENLTPSFSGTTCSNVYCHGVTLQGGFRTTPKWTQVDGTQAACGACHGLPPGGSHPQRTDCEACHREELGPGRTFIRPELHINGQIDVSPSCDTCHGSGGIAAPPFDLAGRTATTYASVGAHREHLAESNWHARVECAQCHVVPESVLAPGHRDSSLPAELTWGDLATHGGAAPVYSASGCRNVYCHGATLSGGFNTEPEWTRVDGSQDSCGSCHSLPPLDGHPPRSDCESCHGDVVGPRNVFVAPALHIDGTVNVVTACDACHGGGGTAAPPLDTTGETETTARGVGAHRSHIAPSSWHAQVACTECHLVPAVSSSPGHYDSALPAELTWGPLATTENAAPNFDGTRCSNTYCHGGTMPTRGGTQRAPIWTRVDGSQGSCGNCHGIPPPAPHPGIPPGSCGPCHPFTGLAPSDPSTHINGVLERQ
ncbi:MAG: CxxxxCH/CxxCH domain-containing protein [Deltaproteobacteria bacterium]|nr:CxxxxCH/CxxCH domain-containing protein [Deltaproteobacteria bacterium]